MRKIFNLIPLLVCLMACTKEDSLAPSNADVTPLIESPDLSKPLISKYKKDYNVSIVYRYNDTTDFRFAFHDRVTVTNWGNVKIKKLQDANVDYALSMFDSLVLNYFKDQISFQGQTITSDFKKNYFPRHIFLSDSLTGAYSGVGQLLGELNLYETDKYYSFLWNGYEPMFAFSKPILSVANALNITKYRNSMLYCFIGELAERHNIYDQMPAAFYEPVSSFYGQSINDAAVADGATVLHSGPGNRYGYYDPAWYTSKGFGLTNRDPLTLTTYSNTTSYTAALDTTKTLTFPDKERDFRNLLHVMICETSSTNIKTYLFSDVFKARMRIFITEMYKRGIDVFLINPAMAAYF